MGGGSGGLCFEEGSGTLGVSVGYEKARVVKRPGLATLRFVTLRRDALRQFLVEEGVAQEACFWKLAQAFLVLYAASSDDKWWVDEVLPRKKGLGF
jgi:putative DNA methylase